MKAPAGWRAGVVGLEAGYTRVHEGEPCVKRCPYRLRRKNGARVGVEGETAGVVGVRSEGFIYGELVYVTDEVFCFERVVSTRACR